MSRHRNFRNRSYSDDYDYDDVYGHSVEEDSCLSPNDATQWLYDRSRNQQAISHFIEGHSNIEEEVEKHEVNESCSDRRNSLDIQSLKLSETDEARLLSCLDQLYDVVGDTFPQTILVDTILKHNFNHENALNDILQEGKKKTEIKNEEPLIPVPIKPPIITTTFESCSKKTSVDDLKVHNVTKCIKGDMDNGGSQSHTPRDTSPFSDRISPKNVQGDDNRSVVKGKEKLDPNVQFSKERGMEKDFLYIIVIGHVDAGKSTLMGRMLCDMGEVSQRTLHKYEQESKKIGKQSFMYAWVLDETGEERVRGITMDIGKAQFETKTKKVIILDAPGHADFIPNMITGAGQADVALLVVDATRGEFESGFELGGQTREHALLVRSLGVNQLAVAVNKLDTTGWSQDRFNEIKKKLSIFLKQAGYKESDITFVPCSGLMGENLVKPASESTLLEWYKGPSLLDVIDNFKIPQRPISKPLRMTINDIFKGTGSGLCVAGRIENGVLNKGDKVSVCPTREIAEVRSININDMPSNSAFAGDQVSVSLSGVDMQNIFVGFILSDIVQQIPVASKFEARIVVFNVKVPITKGYPVLIHHQSLVESANIVKLKALLNKSTGEVLKKKPRCLGNNSVAVVEIEVCRPICIEKYKNVKELGRVMLRVGGVTIAAGLVTDIYNS